MSGATVLAYFDAMTHLLLAEEDRALARRCRAERRLGAPVFYWSAKVNLRRAREALNVADAAFDKNGGRVK